MATKILIIEDTDDIRDALVIAFSEAGFRVAAADRGEEAFLELTKFTPDIVLLDMHLPGMSGLEILKEMRKTLTVPILMFTNSATQDFVKDSIAAGATDYVLKDTGMDNLIDRVNKRLEFSNQPGVPVAPVPQDAKPLIMYVGEDSEVMRLVSATALRLSVETTRISTAKVGLSRAGKVRPAVVISELALRDADGLSLMKAFNHGKDSLGIPVIMVAGNAPPEIRRSAMSHGAAAFYIKPINPVDLEQVIRKLLLSFKKSSAA